MSTTGGGRPDVMSAAAQRDKQLNVAVDENPSHRVFIRRWYNAFVTNRRQGTIISFGHVFVVRARVSPSLSLSFPLSVSVPSVRALNYIYTQYTHVK